MMCVTDSAEWLCFDHVTGSNLTEQCVGMGRCGTNNPAWMNGPHPTSTNIYGIAENMHRQNHIIIYGSVYRQTFGIPN